MHRLKSNLGSRIAVAGALVAVSVLGATAFNGASTAQDGKPAAEIPSAAKRHADDLSQAFRKVAEATVPTVVSIQTRTKARAIRREAPRSGEENPFKGTPFEDFFNNEDFGFRFNDGGRRLFTPPQQGTGSGVIVDASGMVLTNNHVVAGADEIVVRLDDGRTFRATAEDITTDPETDLAVVRLQGAKDLPAASLGDSDQLEIGDWVIAVGTPFGLNSTVSAGIVSGKSRELAAGRRARFLQTDAAINPGNSGGPLVNLNGEVIGINTAIASNNGSFQGIGFAIPSNMAQWVMRQLIENGSVQRAYLGVSIGEVTADLAEQFGVQRAGGVLVSEVMPGTPAAKAGFRAGDVITGFDGKPIRAPRDLQELVERSPADSRHTIKLLRDGKSMELQVSVKPLPSDGAVAAADGQGDSEPAESDRGEFESTDLGIEVSELDSETARQLGFEGYEGVVITAVSPDSVAAEVGLREGMLVLEVGRRPVQSVADFKKALENASLKDGVLLLVRTAAGNRFVVLRGE